MGRCFLGPAGDVRGLKVSPEPHVTQRMAPSARLVGVVGDDLGNQFWLNRYIDDGLGPVQ
jgi:hypothetical protein